MIRSWKLKTVELRPYKERLEPGDKALLGFCVGASSFVTEMVWIHVYSCLHDGAAYLGTVEFPPSSIRDLAVGDSVTFLPKHIIRYKKACLFNGGFA